MSYISLNMILSSSLLILMICGLRRLLRGRISPRLGYSLWLLVVLRLLLPFDIGSLDFSVSQVADLAALEQRAEDIALPLRPYQPAEAAELAAELSAATGLPAAEITSQQLEDFARQQQRIPLTELLFWLWLAGAVALALWQLAVNLRFARRLRTAQRLELPVDAAAPIDCPLPVYLAEGLASPCLFGFFRPRVYLNQPLAGEQLRHILVHELCHWRHGDHWWSLARAVCLCLHWFNPLVWLAAGLSRRDAELACDQSALALLGDAQRIAYGETLLALIRQSEGSGQGLEVRYE